MTTGMVTPKDRDLHLYAQFEWERSDEYAARKTQYGMGLIPVPQTNPLHRYRPYSQDTSDRFLVFAGLNEYRGTPEFVKAVCAFARDSGLLGAPLTRNFQSDDIEYIELDRVRRRPPPTDPPLPDHYAWGPQVELMHEFLDTAAHKNPSHPKWKDLLPKVNAMLQASCGPRLDWTEGEDAMFRVHWASPRSLLGVLWTQAVKSVSSPSSFRQCAVCQKDMEISLHRKTGGRRTDTRFCSTKCRSQDLRNRKKHAKERYRQGDPLTAIAQDLRTNTAVVRGWLKATKTRKRTNRSS